MNSDKKKRNLRIVFMGTPDFAVAGLSALVEKHYHIVGVITAPDKPAGRGRKLNESAVKRYAVEKGLKVLQPANLKNESFLKELKLLRPNLQIVVAFRMLPKVVWQLPEFGTFNLHASLLPQYRGAAPINWVLINGEKKTGVTTFFIDDKIDTGAIITQKETDIKHNDNAGKLYDRLMHLGAKLILQTVALIENNQISTYIQPQFENLKIAPKIFKEDCKINWTLSGMAIFNLIRGLSPYPAAWSYLKNGDDNIPIKIYEANYHKKEHQMPLGRVVKTQRTIQIAVIDGYIELIVIQLPGKRKMNTQDVLNGLKLKEDAFLR